MPNISLQENLYKIVIGLVVLLVFSWSLFGWIVKRWVISSDDKFKELYDRTNVANIEIEKHKAVCEERYKK